MLKDYLRFDDYLLDVERLNSGDLEEESYEMVYERYVEYCEVNCLEFD